VAKRALWCETRKSALNKLTFGMGEEDKRRDSRDIPLFLLYSFFSFSFVFLLLPYPTPIST
jgi:hypothetical protein